MERFSISSTVKSYPHLPFAAMKDHVLGKSYELSLVFVGEARAKRINQESRSKSYVPNVLSFPYTDEAGEIYITPSVAKAEAKKFGHSFKAHIGYLYIHGLLHLKGFDHGPKMERLEKKFMKQFKLA